MKWCKCRELEMKIKIVLIKYEIEDWYTSFFHFCKWIIFYRNQNIVGKTEKKCSGWSSKAKTFDDLSGEKSINITIFQSNKLPTCS